MNTNKTLQRHFVLLAIATLGLTFGASQAIAAIYGTKSSKDVYHTLPCSAGQRITDENRVEFKDEAEAQATGRRKCKMCIRLEEKETDEGDETSKPADKPADKPAKPAPTAKAGEPTKPPKSEPDKHAGTRAGGGKPKAGGDKPADTGAAPGPGMSHIAEVICGDTFKTSTGMTLRLLGVCCPELEQPGGKAAKKQMEDKVLDRDVAITEDAAAGKPKGTEAGKKIIAYAKLPRGKDLTLSLIEQGLGWFDRGCKCSRKDEFVKAEEAARKEKVGVWKPLAGAAATQKVVVFDGSNIYHETDCVHVKKTSKTKEMNVNDAKAAGYVPCGQWVPLVEKKKAVPTKAAPAKEDAAKTKPDKPKSTKGTKGKSDKTP